jgi:Schlafen, AlbA_2
MNLQEQFHAMDAETIQQFKREGRTEDLHLEFKRIISSDFTNENDRKHLAKAVSGFANAAGGLIVWGVITDKRGESATGIDEIEGLSILRKKLEEFAGNWVSPPVDGVLHRVIPISAPDKGCAVTFVPESDSVPHMNNFEQRYYKRNGSRFIPMEHYEVADMFGRRKKPKLKLYTSFSELKLAKVGQEEYLDFELIIGLENIGRGVAKYPYLSMKIQEPYVVSGYGLDGNGHEGLARLPRGKFFDPTRWGAGSEIIIHAGGILEVTKVRPPVTSPRIHIGKDLVIEYEICAEDAATVSGTEVKRYSELHKSLQQNVDKN